MQLYSSTAFGVGDDGGYVPEGAATGRPQSPAPRLLLRRGGVRYWWWCSLLPEQLLGLLQLSISVILFVAILPHDMVQWRVTIAGRRTVLGDPPAEELPALRFLITTVVFEVRSYLSAHTDVSSSPSLDTVEQIDPPTEVLLIEILLVLSEAKGGEVNRGHSHTRHDMTCYTHSYETHSTLPICIKKVSDKWKWKYILHTP